MITKEVSITVRDGTTIGALIYAPDGLGQSYFCLSQWWMGIMKPPALACLGAYDGFNDPYRASCYQGGIPGQFLPGYWWNQNRIINRFPANCAEPRVQETDLDMMIT